MSLILFYSVKIETLFRITKYLSINQLLNKPLNYSKMTSYHFAQYDHYMITIWSCFVFIDSFIVNYQLGVISPFHEFPLQELSRCILRKQFLKLDHNSINCKLNESNKIPISKDWWLTEVSVQCIFEKQGPVMKFISGEVKRCYNLFLTSRRKIIFHR